MSQLPTPFYEDSGMTIFCGKNEDILPLLAAESFHAVVTDPPAGISFMNKAWDSDKGGRNQWVAWMTQTMSEVLRVLKPGAHGLVWALPRTSHWTAWALEEAGWEIRDRVAHIFASGFPKSLDIGKALDRKMEAKREVIGHGQYANRGRRVDNAVYGQSTPSDQEVITAPASDAAKLWNGFGSNLKPSVEDWWLCRKPLIGTICENILAHGCGGLNIDASRIPGEMNGIWGAKQKSSIGYCGNNPSGYRTQKPTARYPSNLLHDGSPEVLAEFDKAGERTSGGGHKSAKNNSGIFGHTLGYNPNPSTGGDTGSAARFFYAAKSSRAEREENLDDMTPATGTTRRNTHPTIKPLALMSYLIRLITPPGGLLLDPFMGSGSTLVAAQALGFRAVGIEQDENFCAIAARRLRQRSLPFAPTLRAETPTVIATPQPELFTNT